MAGPSAPKRAASGVSPLPADDEQAAKKAKKARIVLAWKAVVTLSTRQEAMAYIKSQGYSIFRHSHATSVARCTKHADCVAGNGAHLRVKPARDGMGNVRALPAMCCAAFGYASVLIRILRSSLGAGTSQMLVEGAGEHAGDVVTKSIDPALTDMVDTLLQARTQLQHGALD